MRRQEGTMLQGDGFEGSPVRTESLLVMGCPEKVPLQKEAGGRSGHVIPDAPPPVLLALSYQRSPLHPYPCSRIFSPALLERLQWSSQGRNG